MLVSRVRDQSYRSLVHADSEETSIVLHNILVPQPQHNMDRCCIQLCVVLFLCVLVNITASPGFELHISPRQETIRLGERTSILCRSNRPLTGCRFLLPGNQVVNLDRGADTPATAEYRYYGRGLHNGQCGITLTKTDSQSFSAVACQGRTQRDGWRRAAMFLRITNLPSIQWDIDPQQPLYVDPGQNVSLLCLSNVPLATCRIGFMKDDEWLDLSLGKQTKRTREYQYYGTSLEDGQCGVTLLGVTSDMSQELRCVGIGLNNEWIGDFFSLVVTKEPDSVTLVTSSTHYPDGGTMSATCTISRRRPAPNVTWYLGNELVDDVIVDTSPDDVWFDHEEQTSVQTLTRKVTCADHGKRLMCADGTVNVAVKTLNITGCSAAPASPTVGVTRPPAPSGPQTIIQRPTAATSEPCGVALLSNQLVVNGEETVPGHWPWIAALFVKRVRQGGLEFLCGGTLINRKYIMTAAHCMMSGGAKRRPDDLIVFLGKYNLNDWTEPNSQLKRIQSIHIHPGYVTSTNGSDIAVIGLTQAAVYTNYVRPICMWNKGPNLADVVGQKASVVGWGRLGPGDSYVSDTPRLARTVIVSQDECLRSHQDFFKITSEKTFCAGYKDGSGPCNGDSGSGLVLPYRKNTKSRTQWFLRGIVSLALLDSVDAICDLNQYVVYTDIAKFSDWLAQYNETAI